MKIDKEDLQMLCCDLAVLTRHETEELLDDSVFALNDLQHFSASDKADWAKHAKQSAERRLRLMRSGLNCLRYYEEVQRYIEKLDGYIAAHTPVEVG